MEPGHALWKPKRADPKRTYIEFVPEIDESIPIGLVLQSNLAYTNAGLPSADRLKRTDLSV